MCDGEVLEGVREVFFIRQTDDFTPRYEPDRHPGAGIVRFKMGSERGLELECEH